MRVAKVLLIDDENNALILRRSGTHPRHAYEPDLPGGIIEPGESFEEGLAREVWEEAGIELTPDLLELVTTSAGFGHSKKRLYKAYLGNRPDVTISWEHDQSTWVPLDQFSSAIKGTDAYMHFVENYLAKNAL